MIAISFLSVLPSQLRHNGHKFRHGQWLFMKAQNSEVKFASFENLQRSPFHGEGQALNVTELEFFGVMTDPSENLRDERAHGVIGDAGGPIAGDRQSVVQRNIGASYSRQFDH